MTLLQIPDEFFTSARDAVDKARSVNLYPSPEETMTVLRVYVNLGLNFTIADYASTLSSDEQDAIIEAVGDAADLKYATVRIDLEILENLYLQGLVNPEIAKPNKAQHNFIDSKASETPAPSVWGNAIGSVSDVVKNTTEALLKGLGIDIPLGTIFLIVVFIIALITIRKATK